jgi:UDP-2,3-diacylglucosamine hydrolase
MTYYFAADIHAGLSLNDRVADGESRLVEWLDAVGADARAIFLLGDIFDFWFEYRHLVPKGFVRLLGKLAELTGRGVEIHFFPGNHDQWIGDHFERECGMIVHREALYTRLAGRRVYLAHGDTLGNMGLRERAMHAVFHSRTARRLFSTLVHPDLAMRLGSGWSRHSRKKHLASPYAFRGEKEGVVRFARGFMEEHPVDAFVFGHLHTPIAYPLSGSTTLYVLGDWITTAHPVYGRLDEAGFSLLSF